MVLLVVMTMLAVTLGETAIVTVFDCTLAGLAQSADEVTTQVTASLFAKVALVNMALFVPTFVPFTFH